MRKPRFNVRVGPTSDERLYGKGPPDPGAERAKPEAVCPQCDELRSQNTALRAAINPDGSLTEHEQFVETARDAAHAREQIGETWAETEKLRERLKATSDHFDNLFCAQMYSFLELVERDHTFKMENRKLRERNAELERSLVRYGSHEDHCPKSIEQIMAVGIHGKPPEFCTCGFEAAAAASSPHTPLDSEHIGASSGLERDAIARELAAALEATKCSHCGNTGYGSDGEYKFKCQCGYAKRSAALAKYHTHFPEEKV